MALISLGAGVVLGALVQLVSSSPRTAIAVAALAMAGMAVPVVIALRASRPAGLLRFRPVDVLFGVVLGIGLRLMQGWLASAGGDAVPLPSYVLVDGRVSPVWLLGEIVIPGFVAPVVEEFFFRAVLLVAAYSLLRRRLGGVGAGIVAALLSTGVFVLVHGVGGTLGADDLAALAVMSSVCCVLVLLTGRIWGAVFVHAVFGLSYVALAGAGTLLG